MDVVVIPRNEEHVAACVEALREVHEADAYPIRWPADPVAWLSPADALEIRVAVHNGRVVGHAVLRGTNPPAAVQAQMKGEPAMLSRLFTTPSVRGTGVARRLVDEVTAWSAERAYHLFLDVADNAPGARRFYERLGWQHVLTERADWLDADGRPALVHYYVAG
ncbi:MAG: GNAT family N-acetyltransferase [Hamadaea sp.]|uniref:GNAT family N-acetyltransferase n=1 Tax=Hamadaea sp. TaxID=2024425 RepID=UPI0017B69D67|nr:GNAT family N-acetyltransferase [Hamadaea sp.]NUT21159.1 GNAT family N-acetyltransferase [Hamadaea sp.]